MPVRTRDVPRRQLGEYVVVARGLVVQRSLFDAQIPILLHARAFHMNAPNGIFDSWVAAAYYGVGLGGDSAPISMFVRNGPQLSRSPLAPTRVRMRSELAVRYPDPKLPELAVIEPGFTVVRCVMDLLSERHSWWVYSVPGMSWPEIRSVQLIDAFLNRGLVTSSPQATAGWMLRL